MHLPDPADIEGTGGFPTDAARDAFRAAQYGALYASTRRVLLAQQADDARRKALALVDPDDGPEDDDADSDTHDIGNPVGRAA